MNLTFQQKLTLMMGFIGAATSAFGALGPLMTSKEILIGTVLFGFLSACLAVVATVTSSQSAQVKEVLAMPGVDSMKVNAQANQALATMAVDPSISKIAPTPAALDAVTATASKGP